MEKVERHRVHIVIRNLNNTVETIEKDNSIVVIHILW